MNLLFCLLLFYGKTSSEFIQVSPKNIALFPKPLSYFLDFKMGKDIRKKLGGSLQNDTLKICIFQPQFHANLY